MWNKNNTCVLICTFFYNYSVLPTFTERMNKYINIPNSFLSDALWNYAYKNLILAYLNESLKWYNTSGKMQLLYLCIYK